MAFKVYKADSDFDWLGAYLASMIQGQYDLKLGAGRKIFKVFVIITIIVSSLIYVLAFFFIVGTAHRSRGHFRKTSMKILENEVKKLLDEVNVTYSLNDFYHECRTWMERYPHLYLQNILHDQGKQRQGCKPFCCQ